LSGYPNEKVSSRRVPGDWICVHQAWQTFTPVSSQVRTAQV